MMQWAQCHAWEMGENGKRSIFFIFIALGASWNSKNSKRNKSITFRNTNPCLEACQNQKFHK